MVRQLGKDAYILEKAHEETVGWNPRNYSTMLLKKVSQTEIVIVKFKPDNPDYQLFDIKSATVTRIKCEDADDAISRMALLEAI